MIYTNVMFEEDKKIAFFTFRHYFSTFTFLKEDLIQCALISLWRHRYSYVEGMTKYSTYAVLVSRSAMFEFLRKENRQTRRGEVLSLDKVVGDEFSLLKDLIPDEVDFESKIYYENFFEFLNKEIKTHKSERFKEISFLYVKGVKPVDIGRKLNVSRQCVDVYIRKFEKFIRPKLKEAGF